MLFLTLILQVIAYQNACLTKHNYSMEACMYKLCSENLKRNEI